MTPYCTATSNPDVDVFGLATCALPTFGCNDGEACMPPLPPPGAGGNLLCLVAEGDVLDECPPGWNIQRLASTSAEVECACDCELGVGDDACTGTVRTWTDGACAECGDGSEPCFEVPVPGNGACTALGDTATHVGFDVDSEGTPTLHGNEAALAGTAVTFCCIEYPQEP